MKCCYVTLCYAPFIQIDVGIVTLHTIANNFFSNSKCTQSLPQKMYIVEEFILFMQYFRLTR